MLNVSSAKVNSVVCNQAKATARFSETRHSWCFCWKSNPTYIRPSLQRLLMTSILEVEGQTVPSVHEPPPAKTPTNFWSLKDKKSVKRGLVINEQKYIICWLCSSRKEKMTAINIISVGVNCPELTPPKASWQTDGRRGDLQFSPSDLGHLLYYDHQSSKTEQNDTFCQSKVGFPWRLPPQRWLVLPYRSI